MAATSPSRAPAFDDLRVGDAFRTPEREITAGDVVAFARLTGDHHPVHVDPEWAATSMFGGQIAHGLLVLGFAVGLSGFDPERVIALRSIEKATFKRAAHVGDVVHVEGTVAALKPLTPELGRVRFAWRIVGSDGAALVTAAVEVLWAREAQR